MLSGNRHPLITERAGRAIRRRLALAALSCGMWAFTLGFAAQISTLPARPSYTDPGRVGAIMLYSGRTISPMTYRRFLKLRAAFKGQLGGPELAAFSLSTATFSGAGPARVISVSTTTANFFRLLGLQPTIGRSPSTADRAGDASAAYPGVMISRKFWESAFRGDRTAIGRQVYLDGRPYVVSGVLPSGFALTGEEIDVWITAGSNPTAPNFIPVCRPAPGRSLRSLQARINHSQLKLPQASNNRYQVIPLSRLASGDPPGVPVAPALVACSLIFFLALWSACTEFYVPPKRTAPPHPKSAELPAGLARRVACSAALHAASAVALAAMGATATLPLLLCALHVSEGRAGTISHAALEFEAVIGLLCLVSLTLSASSAKRRGSAPSRRDTRVKARVHPRPPRPHGYLPLICEICVASTLVYSAGLLHFSSAALTSLPIGFNPQGLLGFTVELPQPQYSEIRARAFFQNLLARIGSNPGVASVGAVTTAPLSPRCCIHAEIIIRSHGGTDVHARGVTLQAALPDYFATMGIPILAGRALRASDDAPHAEPVVVISELLSREYGVGIGSQILPPSRTADPVRPQRTVVGIVGNTPGSKLNEPDAPSVYVPASQIPISSMTIVARSEEGHLANLAADSREQLYKLAPQIPARNLQFFGRQLKRTILRQQLSAIFAAALAAAALLLVLSSTFGFTARASRIRGDPPHEQRASGAAPPVPARPQATNPALTPIAIGLLIGAAAAAGTGELVRPLLFETFTPSAAGLTAATLTVLACALPGAWAASKTAPPTSAE